MATSEEGKKGAMVTDTIHDENGHARYGEVVRTRPSADELEEAGKRIKIIRRNLSVLRGEVENLERAWAWSPAHDQRYRDVQGLLTAALIMLHDAQDNFPKWAASKREKLAQPDKYVVFDGFHDQREEDGLVAAWWWDTYHVRFGPNLQAMPWREPEI